MLTGRLIRRSCILIVESSLPEANVVG